MGPVGGAYTPHEKRFYAIYRKLTPVEREIFTIEINNRINEAIERFVKIAKIISDKDPVEVLELIKDNYLETPGPLGGIVACVPYDDNYSMEDLIKDTIDKAKNKAKGTEV